MKPTKLQTSIFNRMKGYLDHYMSTRVIFLIDIVVELVSSGFIMLLLSIATQSNNYAGRFAAVYMTVSFVASLLTVFVFRGYRHAIRHFRYRDIAYYSIGCFVRSVVIFLLMIYLNGALTLGSVISTLSLIALADFLVSTTLTVGIRISMILVYDVFNEYSKSKRGIKRVLVFRTSEKSISMLQRFANSSNFKVVGFITSESMEYGLKVADLPVYSVQSDESFDYAIKNSNADGIMVTSQRNLDLAKPVVANYALSKGIKIYITPGVDEYREGVRTSPVREIQIEDLLGREEIKISIEKIKSEFFGKTVMVTGAAGSIGSELVRQLAGFDVGKLVLFDNGETPLHNLRLELEDRFPELDFVPVIGDVRSNHRLRFVFEKYHPQIVFHAAAYKHVPLMEENPCEAVHVNVVGSRQVADLCVLFGVEKMVMISTDKAVNPTNIMGCTKRLAEIYVQSLGLAIEKGEIKGSTKFITTRFGNVLGSNGSVIPRFRQQILKGGPVTVTHPDITRFFMTIPEACRLVMEASVMDGTNCIMVFDMGESVKIDTLARRMISLSGFVPDKDIAVVYTGLRPGEKLYEEVLSNKENTLPTMNERIRVATVREYAYDQAAAYVDRLKKLSVNVNIDDMVRLMKEVVPEYKSNNSVFEKYDKQDN